MLLRLSLIIAVLAAAGSLFVSFTVSQKIKDTAAELEGANAATEAAKASEAKAVADAKKSKGDAEKAQGELSSATSELQTVKTRAGQQQKRADDLQGQLDKSEKDRTEAFQRVAAFDAIGVPLDKIKEMKSQYDKVVAEKDALNEEKVIFLRQIAILDEKVKVYEEPDKEVKLPAELKGKILAVDPKYDFVILDIGESQGLKMAGKLSISRGGKLVAKAKVVSLEASRCIANVLPEWKQSDVLEGDLVMASYEALSKP